MQLLQLARKIRPLGLDLSMKGIAIGGCCGSASMLSSYQVGTIPYVQSADKVALAGPQLFLASSI